MWIIADFQTEMESETYEQRLEKLKRKNSIERLNKDFEEAETNLLLEPGIDVAGVGLREQRADISTSSDEESDMPPKKNPR